MEFKLGQKINLEPNDIVAPLPVTDADTNFDAYWDSIQTNLPESFRIGTSESVLAENIKANTREDVRKVARNAWNMGYRARLIEESRKL